MYSVPPVIFDAESIKLRKILGCDRQKFSFRLIQINIQIVFSVWCLFLSYLLIVCSKFVYASSLHITSFHMRVWFFFVLLAWYNSEQNITRDKNKWICRHFIYIFWKEEIYIIVMKQQIQQQKIQNTNKSTESEKEALKKHKHHNNNHHKTFYSIITIIITIIFNGDVEFLVTYVSFIWNLLIPIHVAGR